MNENAFSSPALVPKTVGRAVRGAGRGWSGRCHHRIAEVTKPRMVRFVAWDVQRSAPDSVTLLALVSRQPAAGEIALFDRSWYNRPASGGGVVRRFWNRLSCSSSLTEDVSPGRSPWLPRRTGTPPTAPKASRRGSPEASLDA